MWVGNVIEIVHEVEPVHVVHEDGAIVPVAVQIEKAEARGFQRVQRCTNQRVRSHEAKLAI